MQFIFQPTYAKIQSCFNCLPLHVTLPVLKFESNKI